MFDASYHIPAGSMAANARIVASREHDRRWIRVRRPTIVVGGELTLDNLEVRHDARSNTCEAPLQLKSNCGCLLIDDFGRQRVAPAELLNRWIVPLESKIDFLTLPTGKKISVPFEQTILFSTNLQPESLVDEAFMRRVPFKIEIGDPSHNEFVELFRRACLSTSIHWRPDVIEAFIEKQYRSTGRPLRRCHPRDLLAQVTALSAYYGERPELRMDYLQMACQNYFGSSTAAITKAASSINAKPSVANPSAIPSVGVSKTVNRPSLAAASNKPVTHRATLPRPLPSQTAPIAVDQGPSTLTNRVVPQSVSFVPLDSIASNTAATE